MSHSSPHPSTGSSLHDLSFEDALAELEKIVRGLESGQMKLEDALTAYERGAALRHHCEVRLGEAEMRVKAIVQKEDGTIGYTDLTEIPQKDSAPQQTRLRTDREAT